MNPGSLPVVVIGAGGHAAQLVELLVHAGRHVLFATDSDEGRVGGRLGSVEIRRDEELLRLHPPGSVELVNGVGSRALPTRRAEVFRRFRELGYRFATVVHPGAIIAPSASLGTGAQVMAGAVIQSGAHVGEDTIVNTLASVDHDCSVADHVHIAPGVTVCGSVRIGRMSHIGAGSTIIQGLEIGAEVLVGAGSLVLRDVSAGSVVWGSPAREQ